MINMTPERCIDLLSHDTDPRVDFVTNPEESARLHRWWREERLPLDKVIACGRNAATLPGYDEPNPYGRGMRWEDPILAACWDRGYADAAPIEEID